MPTYRFVESAAASAVGTNIVGSNDLGAVEPVLRSVSQIAVIGSAAVGDARVDLFYGREFIGTFNNTRAGATPVVQDLSDWQDVDPGFLLESGEPLRVLIADTGVTNVIVVMVRVAYAE